MREFILHIGDPLGHDFALVDSDGNKIEGITSFYLRGSYGEPVQLEVDIIPQGVNAKVILGSVTLICPACSESFDHDCNGGTLGGKP